MGDYPIFDQSSLNSGISVISRSNLLVKRALVVNKQAYKIYFKYYEETLNYSKFVKLHNYTHFGNNLLNSCLVFFNDSLCIRLLWDQQANTVIVNTRLFYRKLMHACLRTGYEATQC